MLTPDYAPPPARPPTLATVALVFGLLAVLGPAGWFAVVLITGLDQDVGLFVALGLAVVGISAAVVTGILALRQARRDPAAAAAGRGRARAGLVLGLVAVFVYVVGGAVSFYLLIRLVMAHD